MRPLKERWTLIFPRMSVWVWTAVTVKCKCRYRLRWVKWRFLPLVTATPPLNHSSSKSVRLFLQKVFQTVSSVFTLSNSTCEISDWMEENLGNRVSAEMISALTDRVLSEIKSWRSRSLYYVYPIVRWMLCIQSCRRDRVCRNLCN